MYLIFPQHLIIITSSIFLLITSFFPGLMLSESVTLQSIEIFNTHEWLPGKLVVYFRCKDENKTVLPDVKNKHVVYHFKGEESWQPLTDLESKKCKRCGLYEKDLLKSDGVYDEWELCLDDFRDSKYIRFKEKEFNTTFICPDCSTRSLPPYTTKAPKDDNEEGIRRHLVLGIFVGVSVLVLVLGGVLVVYRHWQRRKRRRDQARFMQLFDDGDDLEDELELNHHDSKYHHNVYTT